MPEKTRILILGGGFAGVNTAMELERRFGAAPDIQITLISRDNFVLFTPMLHEVAASDLDLTTIVNPIRKMLRRAQFLAADIQSVDLDTKRVVVTHGLHRHEHILEYDHLVLALGSVTNFYGIEGLEERALTMKSLEDAIRIRNRMIAHLEEADPHCHTVARDALLTFVVAGGGFAGVEAVGGIFDFIHSALRAYPNLEGDMVRIVLVHPGKYPLPELGEQLGRYTQQKLRLRGIEVRAEVKVSSITDEGIVLSDGRFISTMFVLWTAGTSASPHIAGLPCEHRGGRVATDGALAVPGYAGVWALGDCASVPNGEGGFHPPTAQHAIRQATTLARNIVASVSKTPQQDFTFKTIGQLAAIGRRAGVARIFGVQFSGFIAWWMWRTIYLTKLPRMEKRLHVALDWTLDLFFSKDIVQYISFRAPGHDMPNPPEAVRIKTETLVSPSD